MTINLTHTKDEALQGILWSYRGGWITLRDACGVAHGKPDLPIDGDVIVHVRNVASYQVLTPVHAVEGS